MIFRTTKFLLVFFSLTTVIFMAAFVFNAYSIRERNEETFEILNLADQIEEERQVLQSIRLARTSALEDIESLEDLTIHEDELVDFIETLESAARGFGLEIEILSVEEVGQEDGDTGPKTLRISMETGGTWSQNLNFLKAAESFPYRVMIGETDLSRNDSEWVARVTLSINYFN